MNKLKQFQYSIASLVIGLCFGLIHLFLLYYYNDNCEFVVIPEIIARYIK